MGKIKIKTIGEEEQEKKPAVKKAKKASSPVIPALTRSESPSGENKVLNQARTERTERVQNDKIKAKKKTAPASSTKKKRSERYLQAVMSIDKTKKYPLSEALELLPKVGLAKFDETVELHINTLEAGISATLTLPHGTGKQVNVVIADDKILAEVEKGKINFDVLVATPQMMPKLAKVAKILGPKGLMPSPKAGTVTDKPEDVVKKFAGGQMTLKTESKIPVMHASVGKVSFGSKKLSENIKFLLDAVNSTRIRNVTLKSTMSPGIKVDMTSLQ